jgi:hypothetical protein
MCPIADPFIVIRSHDPSIDICPCSSEKILELSLSLKGKMFHKVSWSGNTEANMCKNLLSPILNVLLLTECWLNVRDATSAIKFLMPAIETKVRGEA